MKRITFSALLAASLLTGCSLSEDEPCTLLDAKSEVSLLWRAADFGAADAATLRLCVGKVCEQRRSGGLDRPFSSLSVPLPDADGPGPVPVRLTVTTTAGGKETVTDSAEATLAEQNPNGRNCGPTVWTATFRAEPTGLTDPKGLALQ
ncbi:hypothetical protein OG233_20650 [Streptomyces sp. NBC_01218]|uniref:hypothetical protein n=1 Tax=Streptomyces sp. NBC_01218 TaxID=2903780 RepID=UPI002E11D4DF|nr:hypothetical protein OG233_20650 [Streptomyces sp. NBC_01218]